MNLYCRLRVELSLKSRSSAFLLFHCLRLLSSAWKLLSPRESH